MARSWALAALILTYGLYVVMWLAFLIFLLLGGTALAIGGAVEDMALPQVAWNAGLLAAGVGLLYMAVLGFTEWSRPRRERVIDEWYEAREQWGRD